MGAVFFILMCYYIAQANSPDIFSGFMEKIYKGDFSGVKASVDSGMAVNWETETGLSPVELAAASGNDSITIFLLEHGAKARQDDLAVMAIANNSIQMLEYLEQKGKLSGNWNYGSTAFWESPLCYALNYGSMEVIDFIFPNVDFSDGRPRYLLALSSSGNRLAPEQKARLAKRILNSGYVRDKGTINNSDREAVMRIAREARDTALAKSFGENRNEREIQIELNKELANAKTIGEIDSLIALGADPLGTTGGGCTNGGGKDLTTPFHLKLGKGCYSGQPSAFGFQATYRFYERFPEKVKPELTKRDFLFMAAATGNIKDLKEFIKEYSRDFLTDKEAVTRGGARVISMAADAGYPEVVKYLTDFNFEQKDYLEALEFGAKSGSFEIVKTLLGKLSVNPPADSVWNKTAAGIIDIMFKRRSQLPEDTSIARLILEFGSGKKIRLPAEYYSVYYRKYNPGLFSIVWNYSRDSISVKTLLKNSGSSDFSFLYDPEIMSHVSLAGHEKEVLNAICDSYNGRTGSHILNNVKLFSSILKELNHLLSMRVELDKAVLPLSGWTFTLGEFQIGFDTVQKKFVPVWNVPSLMSEKADFKIWNQSGYWWPKGVQGYGE